MAVKVCPKCSSWRVLASETGSFADRLLSSLSLRRYYCGDCGWQSIGLLKRSTAPNGDTGRLFAWKYVLVALIIIGGTYAFSILVVHLVDGISPTGTTVVSVGASKAASDKATPVIPAAAVPREESAVKVKTVGNRDSKLYHLPGMKYYDRVEAYHRIEFSSEEEAVAAGYHKAPR
ncbi:MAG: hypothetical protein CSYNP_02269 [Syntrophus sp. SKADARSKE-3]|nr:hypothetical protein [Syntrophus sp. SKADARSKE-3]